MALSRPIKKAVGERGESNISSVERLKVPQSIVLTAIGERQQSNSVGTNGKD